MTLSPLLESKYIKLLGHPLIRSLLDYNLTYFLLQPCLLKKGEKEKKWPLKSKKTQNPKPLTTKNPQR